MQPEPNMPTSTPEFQHKTCKYCNTVAEPLATQCGNCGSNLPVALPRPMARLVEAQSHWSMGKTGMVSSGVSLGLGLIYSSGIIGAMWPAILMLLWLFLILPGMLGVTAVSHARGNLGQFGINLSTAVGLWLAGFFIMLIGMALF